MGQDDHDYLTIRLTFICYGRMVLNLYYVHGQIFNVLWSKGEYFGHYFSEHFDYESRIQIFMVAMVNLTFNTTYFYHSISILTMAIRKVSVSQMTMKKFFYH